MRAMGPEASAVATSVGCAAVGVVSAGAGAAPCAAYTSYQMTRAFGGSQSDAFGNAMVAGVTAAAFTAVASSGISSTTGRMFAYGAIGGASSRVQGGSFSQGFISSAFSSVTSPYISSAPGGDVGQITIAAILGGTISSVSGGKFANGAATAAMSYAFAQTANRSQGGGRRSGTAGLSGSQEEAFGLLQAEAQTVLSDLEARIDAAWAANDVDLAVELRDAWFALMKTRVTFSRHGDYAETTTGYLSNGRILDVTMDFDAGSVLHLYRHGAPAVTSEGYFVDMQSGRQGVRELLVHEARHGTIHNIFGPSGAQLTQRQMERDADAFIRKVYP